jgi:hypothetical protein
MKAPLQNPPSHLQHRSTPEEVLALAQRLEAMGRDAILIGTVLSQTLRGELAVTDHRRVNTAHAFIAAALREMEFATAKTSRERLAAQQPLRLAGDGEV